jgi:hypothetical protein
VPLAQYLFGRSVRHDHQALRSLVPDGERCVPNADMASLCQEAEYIPLQLQMSVIPLPDGERDGA